MSPTRRRPAARTRDDDLARGLWTQARLWRVELATLLVAGYAYTRLTPALFALAALLAATPLVAVHVADGAHHRPGGRRRIGWRPYGWPRALAQRTVSATLRQLGRRLKRCPRWLDEVAGIGRRMCRPYANAQTRRNWHYALENAGLPQARVKRIERTRAGTRLHIRVRAGTPADHYQAYSEAIATTYDNVHQVRVTRDPANAARAVATIVLHDPLAAGTGPWVCQDGLSLWNPVPIGLDEDGQTVALSLFEQHVLIGGVTRSGKSNLATMIVAAGALDPNTRLWLVDPKGGMEFGRWHGSADRLATDPADAARMLEELVDVMVERQKALTTRKLTPQDGPLYLLAIDELAQLTSGQGAATFNGLLSKLTAMGAAVGVIVVACTQKPEAKIVPSHIRDNMTVKIALRTLTPQASDTILGDGHAAAGYNAMEISPAQKGTAWLAGLGDDPLRFRSFEVTDEHLDELVNRAAQQHPAARDTATAQAETTPSATAGPVNRPGGEIPGASGESPANPLGVPPGFPTRPQDSPPCGDRVADNRDEGAGDLVPLRVVPPPAPGEKRTAKQLAVDAAVLAEPDVSDRELARRLKVAHKTVGAARRRLGVSR